MTNPKPRQVKKRCRDDKGNLLYKGDVIFNTTDETFYWVSNAFEGIIVSISSDPVEVSLESISDEGYIKRWVGKGIPYAK